MCPELLYESHLCQDMLTGRRQGVSMSFLSPSASSGLRPPNMAFSENDNKYKYKYIYIYIPSCNLVAYKT